MADDAQLDPSPRNLELMYREIRQLEEKTGLHFDTIREQFKSYDEAVKLLQEFANRQPTTEAVNENLKALKELTLTQIVGLKELINARLEGSAIALSAALTTQKEGSDKIERNFTEQFRNSAANITTLTKNFEDKISDVKDRFNTSQGRGQGVNAALAVAGTVLMLAIGIAGFFIGKG